MTTPPSGTLLLHTICDLIPCPDEAARIQALDPTDYVTFAQGYCAVRTVPDFDRRLRVLVLDRIFELMDAETRLILAAR